MEMLSVSHAKAKFSEVARRVIKSRHAVVVRTPTGYVQIAPYDLPEEVTPAARGSLGRFTAEQYRLHNTFGEAL